MPDTFTPVLGLTQPEVGASRDSWGSKWNNNATILDQFVARAMPIGAILDYAGTTPPSGWLVADGRAISRTTYSNLFSVLGTTWGAGDGSTTFNLPSLNGRSTVGPGTVVDQIGTSTTFTLAQQFGMVYNYIAQTHLPAYNLVTDAQGTHSHSGATVSAGPWGVVTDAQGQHSHTGATAGENANHTHSGGTSFDGEHTHQVLQAQPGGGSLAAGGSAGNVAVQTATSNNGAANHQHSFTTSIESTAHAHAIAADGNHAHNVTVTAHAHGIYADGSHQHNVNLGGGGNPFEVMSPILVVTKIIHAGAQAATVVALDAAAPASFAATDPTDEMAAIREELAALRALFAPAGSRVLSSPARGTH